MQQKIESITPVEGKAELNVFGKPLFLGIPTIRDMEGSGDSPIKKMAGEPIPCTVICYRESTDTFAVNSVMDLIDLFKLKDDTVNEKDIKDAQDAFTSHFLAVVNQLQLKTYKLENGMVIVSSILEAVAEQFPDDSFDTIKERFKGDRDFTVAISHMGAATLVSEIVKSATDIYNNLHCYGKVGIILDTLKSMTTVDPYGNKQGVSVQQLENIFDNIKSRLFIC